MRVAHIIISFALLAFSGFYAVLIAGLPDRDLPNTLGAAFVPWVLDGFLALLSLLLLAGALLSKHDNARVSLPKRDLWGIAGLLLLIIIYIQLMSYLGFILVSVCFLALLTWFSGSKNPLGIILFSVTTTAAVYLLFHNFFNIQLPAGVLF